MKLREHPKLKGKWPPEWLETDDTHPCKTHPIGEQGVLKEVKQYIHGPSGHMTLLTRFKGEEHFGQIAFDDVTFLQVLFTKLTACVRLRLEEIGSVDLDF
jgi:hypothetical protein